MPEDFNNWYRKTYGAEPLTSRLDNTGRDPQVDTEWRYAVDSAAFLLLIDSARAYGLIEGGPTVDTDRCARLLAAGKKLGFKPRPIPALIADFLEEAIAPPPPVAES